MSEVLLVLSVGVLIYCISEYGNRLFFKRIADSAEERNRLEAKKVEELIAHNNWRRAQIPRSVGPQSKIEQTLAEAKKNGKNGQIIV